MSKSRFALWRRGVLEHVVTGALALVGSLTLACAGCTSSELRVGAGHPASTAEAMAAFSAPGRALEPDFEPSGLGPESAPPPDDPHAGHSHVAPAPSSESKPAPATDAKPSPGTDAKPLAPDDGKGEATRWTCPMHTEIVQAKPGNCPMCGMKLTPVTPPKKSEGSR